MENNMLKVQLNLAEGVYVISRNDGKEEVIKSIKDGAKNNYNKANMNNRRREIEKLEGGQSKWIPSDLLNLVDPVLYDALEEFDMKYGTQYRSGYVKSITKQIPRVGMSEFRSKKRQYQERALKERTDDLREAGISIEYDVNFFGNGLSLMDNIRALRMAKAQKTVGATVKNKQKDFIVDKITDVRTAITQGISNIRTKMAERKARLAQKKLVDYTPRDENGLIDDVPELSEEDLKAISSATLEQTGQVLNLGNDLKQEVGPAVEADILIDGENIVPVGKNPSLREETAESPNPSIRENIVVGKNGVAAQVGKSSMHTESGEQNNASVDEIRVEEPVVVSARVGEPKAKKTISRSKAIQASKQAARDAGKLKNSYQARIQAKADSKKAADEGKQKAAAKREEEAKKAAEAAKLQAERQAIDKAIRIQHKKNQEKAKRPAEEAARALNEKKLSTRLSRKLKSVQDSIRNKVHMPDMNEYGRKITGAVTLANENIKKIKEQAVVRFTRTLKDAQDSIKNKVHIPNLTGQQKAIAGIAAAFALTAAIGVGVAATQASADASARVPTNPTAPIVESIESTRPELSEAEELVYKQDFGDKKDTTASTMGGIQQGTTQNNNAAKQEKSEEEQQKEYLSSIKVGSNMKIDSGKYFASPDGTGVFGHFENYQDGVKEITIIGITTNEGYKVIKDSNVSLYELKQQYPNAKFSYHFVFRHSDGRTTTLGWLTENSMEQNIQMENIEQADEGR